MVQQLSYGAAAARAHGRPVRYSPRPTPDAAPVTYSLFLRPAPYLFNTCVRWRADSDCAKRNRYWGGAQNKRFGHSGDNLRHLMRLGRLRGGEYRDPHFVFNFESESFRDLSEGCCSTMLMAPMKHSMPVWVASSAQAQRIRNYVSNGNHMIFTGGSLVCLPRLSPHIRIALSLQNPQNRTQPPESAQHARVYAVRASLGIISPPLLTLPEASLLATIGTHPCVLLE